MEQKDSHKWLLLAGTAILGLWWYKRRGSAANASALTSDYISALQRDTEVENEREAKYQQEQSPLPPLPNTLSRNQPYLHHGILLSNPDQFFSKKRQLLLSSISSLQIIADFDRTLTAFATSSGKMSNSSHGIIECSRYLSADYKQAITRINDKYFPLEISPHISDEQRIIYMIEWWTQAHELMVKQNIQKHYIDDAVQAAMKRDDIELRKKAPELLQYCHQLNIPFLIFSAGLGDVIASYLQQLKLLTSNVHLVSNFMQFDAKQHLIGFGDIIHTLNKTYQWVERGGQNFTKDTQSRHNVILMGDNLGDANMNRGLDNDGVVVKIGFLHDHVSARLSSYLDAFDVVILNDGSMEFVIELLRDIANHKA